MQLDEQRTRAAPLVMGAVFVLIGVFGLIANPDGFDMAAIWLVPAVLSTLTVGALIAAVTHGVSKRS